MHVESKGTPSDKKPTDKIPTGKSAADKIGLESKPEMLSPATRLRLLDEWDKDMEVQDHY